jgi:hypothetical protein
LGKYVNWETANLSAEASTFTEVTVDKLAKAEGKGQTTDLSTEASAKVEERNDFETVGIWDYEKETDIGCLILNKSSDSAKALSLSHHS